MSTMEETVELLEDINKLVKELFTVNGPNQTLDPTEFTDLLQKQNEEIDQYSNQVTRLQKELSDASQTITDLKYELEQKSKMVDSRTPALVQRHNDNEIMKVQQKSLQQANRIKELEDALKQMKIKNYELKREKDELKKHSRKRSMALHDLEDDHAALRKELQTKNDNELEMLRREVELLRISTKGQGQEIVARLRKEALESHKMLKKTQEERDQLAYDISTKRKATKYTHNELEKEFKAERMGLIKKITALETRNKELEWDNEKKKEELLEADTGFQEMRQKNSTLDMSIERLSKENTSYKNKVAELTIQLEKVEKNKKSFVKRGDKRLSAMESRMDLRTSRKLNQTDKVLKGYQAELKKLIEMVTGVCGCAKKTLEKKQHKDMVSSLEEVRTIAENLCWKMGVQS